jgi:hypothetical protein
LPVGRGPLEPWTTPDPEGMPLTMPSQRTSGGAWRHRAAGAMQRSETHATEAQTGRTDRCRARGRAHGRRGRVGGGQRGVGPKLSPRISRNSRPSTGTSSASSRWEKPSPWPRPRQAMVASTIGAWRSVCTTCTGSSSGTSAYRRAHTWGSLRRLILPDLLPGGEEPAQQCSPVRLVAC